MNDEIKPKLVFKDLPMGALFRRKGSKSKAKYIKTNMGHCAGALYGKNFNNWKAFNPDVEVELVEK